MKTSLRTPATLLAVLFTILFAGKSFGQITTTLTITTCDTTIIDPMPGIPVGYTYLTIQSANNTRIAYSVNYYDSNYGPVYIYDGPNNTSPQITMLGDPFSVPNQLLGAQSTGSTLTFSYPSHAIGDPQHFYANFRCVDTPAQNVVLQAMPALSASGNIKVNDYDNDGDKDLLVGGKVLRNDSYFDSAYKFERKSNVIDGWNHVNLCTADFDNDGYKDIFITGNATVFNPLIGPRAAIYKGSASGTFTLVTPQTFTGATRGGCSIVDFNNDGRPDICYTGATDYWSNNNLIFKVYLNNGNMSFTDANSTLPGITGLVNASMSWADGDADGDKDLLINGHRGNANVATLFIRNGSSFTNSNLSMTATSAGSLSWVDVNLDGKPDIVNTGVATPDNVDGIVPEIYINNGGNNFSFTQTNLPARAFVSSDWANYDGDNDMDILLSGWTLPTGTGSDAGVYKNNGGGQFTKVSSLNGIDRPTKIKWNDFNHDGKLDVISGGYFLKNMGADSFRIASFRATSYENYPGSTVIDDMNNDGLIDIFLAGETLSDVDCNYKSSSTIVYGRDWSLSAIPKFTQVADVNSLNPIIPGGGFFTELYFRWGDFDSDGKQDILMSGDNYAGNSDRFLVVYKNNGNNNFSLYFNSRVTPLPPPPFSSSPDMDYIGLFDIDNDGINELFATPNVVYKNNGGQWTISSYAAANTSNTAGANYMDFADFDQDGFTDVVVSNQSATVVFKNDGAGNMNNITPPPPGYVAGQLGSSSERQVQWIDFDNDGDQDILTSGGIFENSNGSFNFLVNPIASFVHASMGDINNDGFKDLVTVPRMTDYGPMELHYGEQGTGFFVKHSLGTLVNGQVSNTTFNNGVEVFDVDNDGDDDFVYSGGGNCGGGAQVIVNEGNFTDRLVHVLTPNGGENYSVNSTTDIKWYGNQVGATVKIELTRDSGVTWQLLTASTTSSASGGTYSWNVTNPVSKKCLVRVTDNSNTIFADKSNAVFEISVSTAPVANAGTDTLICAGETAHIGTPAVGNNTYSWVSSDGTFSSSLADPVVTPVVNTSYTLTVSNGALTATDIVYVSVRAINISLPDTLLNVCIGDSYSIGLTAQPGVNYEWQSMPAGFTSSQSNPNISAVNTSDVYYYVLATDISFGCTATGYVHVITDSCTTSGGIVANLYPNPANNQVTIQLLSNPTLPVYLKLVNTNGVTVLTQALTATSTLVNLSGYQSGNYYYTVSTPGGQFLQSGILIIIH